MLSDETLCYLFLLISFIALVVFIKLWPSKNTIQQPAILKYQKYDLLKSNTTILTVKEFEQEIAQLSLNNYEFTVLKELYEFVEHQTPLPDKAFVILMEYEVSEPVKALIITLTQYKKSILFFNPSLQIIDVDKKITSHKESSKNTTHC